LSICRFVRAPIQQSTPLQPSPSSWGVARWAVDILYHVRPASGCLGCLRSLLRDTVQDLRLLAEGDLHLSTVPDPSPAVIWGMDILFVPIICIGGQEHALGSILAPICLVHLQAPHVSYRYSTTLYVPLNLLSVKSIFRGIYTVLN
jgi:hypothetical protein